MIIDAARLRNLVVAALVSLMSLPDAMAATDEIRLVYLTRQDDPYYRTHRAYTGLTLREHHRAIDGIKVGLRESRILTRGFGIAFKLLEMPVAPEQTVNDAIRRMREKDDAKIFILDLPIEDVRKAAGAFAADELLLFNVRNRDDSLRGADCSPVLFHTIASRAMLMDALAQYLFKKNWTEVLALEGPGDVDAMWRAAFAASARKFRLKMVDTRPFVLSNDPRQRDQSNVILLTSDADYDVIYLADSLGEFGRYLPYQTKYPRPVVGSEGLIPSAWHWAWERHGAPQLNQRFDRIAKRRMTGPDWAAWVAVKSIVTATVYSKSRDIMALRSALRSDDFRVDAYQGAPANFRPWDNQLRQSILLHTHNAVIARAPIDGFLHEKNNLDTLGVDARESTCRFR
jgi:ABC transporter substrate binding protein (PQQ-dependent alcohol dehydrogenase system)